MKPPIALMLVVLLGSPPRAAALDANKAAYAGGTVFSLNAADGPIEGRLDLGSNELVFAADARAACTRTISESIKSSSWSWESTWFGRRSMRSKRAPVSRSSIRTRRPGSGGADGARPCVWISLSRRNPEPGSRRIGQARTSCSRD